MPRQAADLAELTPSPGEGRRGEGGDRFKTRTHTTGCGGKMKDSGGPGGWAAGCNREF